MNKNIVNTVAAGLITAAIVAVFVQLDDLKKGQAEIRERVVRIETVLNPKAENYSKK